MDERLIAEVIILVDLHGAMKLRGWSGLKPCEVWRLIPQPKVAVAQLTLVDIYHLALGMSVITLLNAREEKLSGEIIYKF
jgi:hypothetical protein